MLAPVKHSEESATLAEIIFAVRWKLFIALLAAFEERSRAANHLMVVI